MASIKSTQNERYTLSSIKIMVETYEEIAAIRMRKVKKSVLENREFMQGLNDIYQHVAGAYRDQLIKPGKGRKSAQTSVMQTNGKSVSVLLSANSGFYGNIVSDTFRHFINDVRQSPTDIVIVGKVGRQMFEAAQLNREYKCFDFSDTGFDEGSFKKLITYTVPYTHIIVYHGFFKSILSQVPKRTLVTGEAAAFNSAGGIRREKGAENERKEMSLFEPSLEEVALFFEKQILSSVFQQSIFESSLSKFASRMVSLDYTTVHIADKIRKTDFELRKLKHNLLNKSQLSRLSSMSLWKESQSYGN